MKAKFVGMISELLQTRKIFMNEYDLLVVLY